MSKLDTLPWLVIGGSDYATPDVIEACIEQYKPVIITTNSGIEYDPHYYFLTDRNACDKWHERTYEIQDDTTLITIKRNPSALEARGLSHFDVFLELEPVYADLHGLALPQRYIPGKYVSAGFSGLFCLQFAANQNPRRIIMIGMEGYDEYDWTKHIQTMNTIGPFTQDLIEKCPGTEFIFIGTPEYELEADNLVFMEIDDG